ncbi:MAG TPA: dienelactone hydrolase family protein [Polyangiaceae bacterium]
MPRTTVTIETRDGRCEASVLRPEGAGPWPAVLFFMDGIGIRPALFEMGERLAAHGYYVLLPDLLYRAGPYVAPDPRTVFADPVARQAWISKYIATVSQANARSDVEAFLSYLSAQPEVRQPKVGTTGYCMGGSLSLATAGNFPERVVAAASYHGGRLATDAPDSPHLLAPRMKARVYVAGAVEDAGFPDDMKARLDDALTRAGVDHTVETYEGARHGWVPKDTPVHDPAAAERHWKTLFALFDATLKPA